jgi:hypothetical protein
VERADDFRFRLGVGFARLSANRNYRSSSDHFSNRITASRRPGCGGISRAFRGRVAGAGKPLNFDDYFNTPEDVRMGYSVLKSNNFVPEEADRFKEISELKEKIKSCTDEEENGNSRKFSTTEISP